MNSSSTLWSAVHFMKAVNQVGAVVVISSFGLGDLKKDSTCRKILNLWSNSHCDAEIMLSAPKPQ